MKAILTCIAFAAMAGTALAQAEQRPADDLLSVKPIASQAQTTDTDMIRSKIERMDYTDVVDLSRDSTGIWHARAKRGIETIDAESSKGAGAAGVALGGFKTRAQYRGGQMAFRPTAKNA